MSMTSMTFVSSPMPATPFKGSAAGQMSQDSHSSPQSDQPLKAGGTVAEDTYFPEWPPNSVEAQLAQLETNPDDFMKRWWFRLARLPLLETIGNPHRAGRIPGP
jgi:hypothetical protein